MKEPEPGAFRSASPLDGRVLNDRYELLDVVGSGGMATVFRARDLRLGRSVAIKVLNPQFAADQDFLQRFRQEAEFAASLSAHPNIVSIYDVGDDADLHFIVMEFVEGRNLKDLIGAEAPLSVERTFAIGQQIASALEFAHQRGLVHRDIKPQNILVEPTSDGGPVRVKVTDFGIARSVSSSQMTRTGMVMGTAQYLAPEQAMGQSAGPSSDIYGLGVVLFEMLTARLPFEADNPLGMAMQHVHETPQPPNKLNPAVSPGAAAVVLRALNKDPADRYLSVAGFSQAMHDAGSAIPVQGQSDSDDQARTAVHPRLGHGPIGRTGEPGRSPRNRESPDASSRRGSRRFGAAALSIGVMCLAGLAAWLSYGAVVGSTGANSASQDRDSSTKSSVIAHVVRGRKSSRAGAGRRHAATRRISVLPTAVGTAVSSLPVATSAPAPTSAGAGAEPTNIVLAPATPPPVSAPGSGGQSGNGTGDNGNG